MTSMFALWTSALMALGGPPVTEVAVTSVAQHTSVLIAVDGDVQYRDFTMEGPYRLVMDLRGARLALPQREFKDLNRGGIQSILTSQYSADVVRVVLVLKQKLEYTVVSDPRGIRLNLDNPDGAFPAWSSGTPATLPAQADAVLTATPQGGDVLPPPATPAPQQSTARHVTVNFESSPIQNVLVFFANWSGKTIIPGSNVTGLITASIQDQPWDVALNGILGQYGFIAKEDDNGIIHVDNVEDLNKREAIEPIITQAYRINYATAAEVQQQVEPLLTERGKVTAGQGTNTLVVNDIQRVQNAVAQLLTTMDVQTPEVSIEAKIVFVDRTNLDQMGVTYELKDSRGNQFNELSSGAADLNGDGVIDPETEIIPQHQQVVLLGGNSIAALGNAKDRLTSPSVSLLSSLVIGRHQLVSFLDALKSVNLSDVQAAPQVTVLDNQEASIKVGADIPVRTIDAGSAAGAGAGGTFPRAQVSTMETGIILRATPHVTANGKILMDLHAERSSAQLASSDVGFIKNTQVVTTRVLVADGETVSMGGLTQSEKTETRSGIPLLMDLPVLGRLFRVNQSQTIQRDLIILVTPHIVRGHN
ncbi:MAG: AMIN domain-containing protein [Gemmatimonadetes bacterium]|nr:AMIN domain-containing protein [Gemmatimonadota bacterium]